MPVHISAIVVAAGRGTRMGSTTAKVFLPLAGVPMVVHSLRTLSRLAGLTSIHLIVAPDQMANAAHILETFGPWPVGVHLAAGGAERHDSVVSGLARVDASNEFVMVHDAARPLVSVSNIEACIAAAHATGAAILARPAEDTLKLANPGCTIDRTLDRRTVWLAQTPQIFRTALLRAALAQAQRDGFSATDDAAFVEHLGAPVQIVPGESTNRKITTPEDLRWAEAYLQARGAPA